MWHHEYVQIATCVIIHKQWKFLDTWCTVSNVSFYKFITQSYFQKQNICISDEYMNVGNISTNQHDSNKIITKTFV